MDLWQAVQQSIANLPQAVATRLGVAAIGTVVLVALAQILYRRGSIVMGVCPRCGRSVSIHLSCPGRDAK